MNKRELKPGWKWVKLGDVATNYSKHVKDPANSEYERYVGSNHMDRYDFRIRNWGDSSEITSSKIAFETGDYLFVGRSLYASDFRERTARADFPGVCSNGILVIRENPELIADGFLAAVLYHPKIWDYVIANGTGSLTRYIYWKQLANYEFSLPPVDEQRRIADLLWAADDSITEHQNLLSTLEKLELSLVAKHTQAKDSWQKKQIKEFADVSYGLTVDPSRRKTETERPYLRVANVWRNSFDFSEIKNIGFVEGDDKRFSLQVNDVLVVEGHANIDEIGRAAIWLGQIPECLHQNHILKIRVRNEKEVHPRFLLIFMNSPFGKSHMRSRSKSTSGLNTINSTVLNTMEIPIPSYEEQEEILEIIGEVEKTREVTNTHLENSLALKKQLLSSSLSG
jgi:type I restriction enzyme, S subunit